MTMFGYGKIKQLTQVVFLIVMILLLRIKNKKNVFYL